jgi:hypothetical protein
MLMAGIMACLSPDLDLDATRLVPTDLDTLD